MPWNFWNSPKIYIHTNRLLFHVIATSTTNPQIWNTLVYYVPPTSIFNAFCARRTNRTARNSINSKAKTSMIRTIQVSLALHFTSCCTETTWVLAVFCHGCNLGNTFVITFKIARWSSTWNLHIHISIKRRNSNIKQLCNLKKFCSTADQVNWD